MWKFVRNRRPRVLIVTSELSESRLLGENGKTAPCVKAGGLADVSALLLDTLSDMGADVHVALPHYRSLISIPTGKLSRHLHLCEDREFYYRHSVYEGGAASNLRAAMAFQRDVIYYVIPSIRPDIVHCHDWMTGLIPAAAKAMGIPSIFTLHNLHDEVATLGDIEDRGIDAAWFWQHLYFHDFPGSYESTRDANPASLLASGALAADELTTVSPSFLQEISAGLHGSQAVRGAVRDKMAAGRAHGILNSLSPEMDPNRDPFLPERYDAQTHVLGKMINKRLLQEAFGLEMDPHAPLIFWPSRLEPSQKGCQLLESILHQTVGDYWGMGLQFAFVADGPSKPAFEAIVANAGLEKRVVLRPFSEHESRLGYASADFVLMPSCFEPCGLSQMIGLRYGSLPIVHATGGLRDTVRPLDQGGNGFVFEDHDCVGLRWAIDEAMRFYTQPSAVREARIATIMMESATSFLPETMIDPYLQIYQRILNNR